MKEGTDNNHKGSPEKVLGIFILTIIHSVPFIAQNLTWSLKMKLYMF